jgi:ABC-type transport system involved in multi-copper enzyme maturation permease subunit
MTDWRSTFLWGPVGVAWFELRRSLSPGRVALWLVVAFFPMVLSILVRIQAGSEAPNEAFVLLLFFLVVRVACVMGLLLWATPVVSNEIEGRTWIYVVSRPGGCTGLVLGKYAVATLWSISAGLVASTTAVVASGVDQMLRTWLVISGLSILGCFAYGALFTLIGTLIQRRAMVVAILYTVIVEGVLSMVPATINRFTVGYRLLALLADWMNFDPERLPSNYAMLFTETSSYIHIGLLGGLTVLMVGMSIGRVRIGGYLTEKDT